MKKKALAVLLSMATLVTLLAGCGSSGTTGTSDSPETTESSVGSDNTSASSGEVVELTFTGWEASPLETEAVENGIKIFEEEHPNIKVSLNYS